MKTNLNVFLNQYRPFIKDKNFSTDEILKMIADGVREYVDKEYKDFIEKVARTGIHSPIHDSNINKFNALVSEARSILIHQI